MEGVSGWAARRWAAMRPVSEADLSYWVQTTVYSCVAGFVVGGFAGSKEAADAFKASNTNTRFVSNQHAQQEMNYAALNGFKKTGLKWGLKAGAFVLAFGTICLQLERFRGRRDIVNVVAAGTTVGAVFGGLESRALIVKGGGAGAILSAGFGVLLTGVWALEDSVAKRALEEAELAEPAATNNHDLDKLVRELEASIQENTTSNARASR